MSRLEPRIAKLEKRDNIGDDLLIYVEWHAPSPDKKSVCHQAPTDPGPKCYFEWRGDRPLPEARWTTMRSLPDDELDRIFEVLNDDTRSRPGRDEKPSPRQQDQLTSMTDNELLAVALPRVGHGRD